MDLSTEAIRLHGVDIWYMPRVLSGIDPVFQEQASSTYDRAYLIDVLFKNPSWGFGGLGDFNSSSGLTIDDTCTLVVSRRTFISEVGDHQPQVRPLEGDLVFLPFAHRMYQVEFVEHESTFYQGGALQVWELRCRTFDYSGEVFDTGVDEIDSLADGYGLNLLGTGILLEDGGSLLFENGLPIADEVEEDVDLGPLGEQNDYFQREGLDIIDWTEDDPFADGLKY